MKTSLIEDKEHADGRETVFGFRPSNVTKIVLTGGTAGGKTQFIEFARDKLEARGYTVLTINETSTEQRMNGIREAEDFDAVTFQRFVTDETIWKERFYEHVATEKDRSNKIIIICDRGVLDGKAFLDDDPLFELMLEEHGMTTESVLDAYDGVIHLVTAADGARDSYGNTNNPARTEDADGAMWVDAQCRRVWSTHPHWICVDNRVKDFDEKLNRALEALLSICEDSHVKER